MIKIILTNILTIQIYAAGLTSGIIPVAIPATPGATSSLSNGPMAVLNITNITAVGDIAPFSIHLSGSNILDIITTYGGGIPSLSPFIPSGNNASLPGQFTALTVQSDLLNVNNITVTNGLTATNSTLVGGIFSGYTNSDLTASRVVVSDAQKKLASVATTSTEIGFVNGVTSAIQTQLNAKQASFSTGAGITNIANVLTANLSAGSNVTLSTNSGGAISIASSGGGGSSLLRLYGGFVAVSNSVVETTLLTGTIPANTFGTTKSLLFESFGDYFNFSGGSRSIQIKMKYGGVTLIDATTAVVTSQANHRAVFIRGMLGNSSANNSQVGQLKYEISVNGAPASGYGNFSGFSASGAAGGISAVDSTVDQTFVITATLSNAETTSYYNQGTASLKE